MTGCGESAHMPSGPHAQLGGVSEEGEDGMSKYAKSDREDG